MGERSDVDEGASGSDTRVLRGGAADVAVWRRGLAPAAAAFALISFGLFAEYFFGPSEWIASNPIGDTARYFAFLRTFYAEQLAQGNVPLWNPYSFSGLPFVGIFQSAVFYPPNLVYLVFPLTTALMLDFAVHLALLGTFSYAWLRGWRLHAAAAFFGALMIALGAPNFLRILAGQLTVLDTLVWSPLLLLAIDRLGEKPSLGWVCVGVAATSLMLTAGHPPTVFMAGFVTAMYALLPLARSAHKLRFVLHLVPVAALPVLLTGAQLFTGLELAQEGIRSGGMDFEFATSFSFPPENLLTLVVSDAFGDAEQFKRTYFGRWFYWDASAFLGVVGLLFAVHGAVRGRGAYRNAALVLSLVILVISLGRYTPLYAPLFEWVPGFGHFRAPSKFMFYAAIFIGALAAIGLDRLLAEQGRARVMQAAALGLGGLVGGFALYCLAHPPGDPGSAVVWLARLHEDRVHGAEALGKWQRVLVSGATRAALLLFVVGALLHARGRFPARSRLVVRVIVVIGVVELLHFAYGDRGGTDVWAEDSRRPKLVEAYAAAGDGRVLYAEKTSDIAMREHGFDIWGYDPVVLLRYTEFMAFTQGCQVEDLDNIRGHPPGHDHPLLGLLRLRTIVHRWGGVVEKDDVLPRFMLVSEHAVAPSRESVLIAIDAEGFDARRKVVLETEPQPAPVRAGGREVVELLAESTDHLDLQIEVEHPRILVITDAYARGWRAVGFPDSVQRDYQLLPGNYVLRAIPLAAGVHHLRVEYAPRGYRYGLAASAAGGVVYTALLVSWWVGRRRAA